MKINLTIDWFSIIGMTSYLWVLACLGTIAWELDEVRRGQSAVTQTQCLVFEGNIRCMTWETGDNAAMVAASKILYPKNGPVRAVHPAASAILVEE